MVAGRRADADAVLVGTVNGLSPDPRREAAHAEGEHVAPLLDGIVHRLGERAGPEQNHPVGDPERHDLRVRYPAYILTAVSGDFPAGEDPDRPGAVSGVVDQEDPIVGILGAVRIVAVVDETPLQVASDMFWYRFVLPEVARIDMSDTRAWLSEIHQAPG